ncbi:MAG: SlyX family protein [Pseudomonas sp.]
MEKRMTDMESRLAFQDDALQALDDVLVTQQREVERLQLQMVALLKRQEEQSSQSDIEEDEAPPPHY